jgi:hypothetical protein
VAYEPTGTKSGGDPILGSPISHADIAAFADDRVNLKRQ